jgi:hypothetical protein
VAAREAQPELTFHQGVVAAWNVLAGTNSIRVLGATMTNLPSLIGSEVGLVRAGDVVGVLRYRNTYFVVGRIEGSGAAQRAFGMASARADDEIDVDSSTGSSFVTLPGGPEVSVDIGSSRRCRVDLSGFVRSYAGVAEIGLLVSGASNIAPDHRKVLSASGSSPMGFVSVQMSATRTIHLTAADGLNEGTNTFTMVYRFNEDDASGAGTFADREISVQPF